MRWVLGALLIGGCAVACAPSSSPEVESKHAAAASIVGGTTTQASQWEGLIQTENDDQGAWCGATLIAADWAVSAAHCYFDTMPMGGFQRVVLGRTNTSAAGSGETIDVDEAFIHEAYDADSHQNDIALMHLSRKSSHEPVHLATPSDWSALNQASTNVTVVGWGATQEGATMSDALRQVTVPVVPTAECNDEYEGIITDSQICAGLQNGGKDSCQGDSGGPLFANQNGQKIQVGIVSFGNGCAEANFAGVYTSIASFRDWIEEKTQGAVPATAPPVITPDSTSTSAGSTTTDTPATKPGKSTSTSTSDGDDDDDDAPATKPSATKKKKRTSSDGDDDDATDDRVASAGCSMSHGQTTESGALFVLFALAALSPRFRSRSPNRNSRGSRGRPTR